MNAIDSQSFSEKGSVTRTTTTPVVANLCAIQCVTDCVFSALPGKNFSGDSLEGEEIPGGIVLYGHFTGYTLTSGIAIGHIKA